MVTEKSKANLKKGRTLADRTKDEQRNIARMGGKASGKARREKKNLIELFEIAQQARVHDEKIAQRLRSAGLPETFAGQMAFNVIQKAGTNPMMLRTLLEATGLLNTQNNVTVNAVPIIIGGENELQ